MTAFHLASMLLVTVGLLAQDPPATPPVPVPVTKDAPAAEASGEKSAVADPLAAQVQKLIDAFLQAMPPDPTQLRRAEVRAAIAPRALPALSAVRTFVDAHPDCSIAPRVDEFSIYALVLGDEPLRRELGARAATDPSARLLLSAAAAIAADDKARPQSIAAVARDLRPPTGDGSEPEAAGPNGPAMRCAATCLIIAAGLSEAEARRLAEASPDEEIADTFRSAAERIAHSPQRLVGRRMELTGHLVTGEPFSLEALRGQVVLVDFWATWCGPCVRALPEIARVRRKYADQGLVVVGVSSDFDKAALEEFLAAHPDVDWPQLFDPDAKRDTFHPAAVAAGVDRIPQVFLIDRQGIVRSVTAMAELDGLLARFLAR